MRILTIATATALVLPSVASAQMVQPGMWETIATVTSVKGGNFPPNVAAMMKGRPTVVRHCVTPAEAAAGPREMVKSAPDCKFSKFSMVGGHYNSQMSCLRQGMTMTVTASGTYTPVSMASSATMVMTGRMPMTMTSSVKARRLGACK